MADYVLSAKGTYDGSNFDSGVDGSASKLKGLTETAKGVGSQVAGYFANSFGSVAKSIGNAIGTVTAGVTTLAATGGMSRALNIEKAQTMFKGMKLEWSDFYSTIQQSVDGTAFGFDTAAQACAQLAASGVAAGNDMEKALNGCVGTAATFGQDLGDLSSIWAKVAANGKLSGEQVAQFTDRGINAISALSTYLGKSSDEVSKMVTAGKIDFQTFSDAMYSAFGDSAKAANETFTGSMANMKAALSKIGQDWMTPLKDSAIPVFNSIRGVLNSCRAALKPLTVAFGEFLGVTYDAQGNLTRTGGAVEKVCGFLDSLAEKIQGVDLSQLGTGGKVAAAALAGLAAVSLGGLIGQIPVLGALANSLTGGIVPALKGVACGRCRGNHRLRGNLRLQHGNQRSVPQLHGRHRFGHRVIAHPGVPEPHGFGRTPSGAFRRRRNRREQLLARHRRAGCGNRAGHRLDRIGPRSRNRNDHRRGRPGGASHHDDGLPNHPAGDRPHNGQHAADPAGHI